MDGGWAICNDNLPLIKAAVDGDAAAFDTLVHDYAPRIYRLALQMLGNHADAEDVQQETFILAYRKLRSFRGDASFNTWLCAITVKLCLSRRRSAASRSQKTQEAQASLSLQMQGNTAVDVAALATTDRVQGVLAGLNPSDRLLIVLRFIEEFNHEEIAQVLGCSIESSRARLLRAKKIFRERYEEIENREQEA